MTSTIPSLLLSVATIGFAVVGCSNDPTEGRVSSSSGAPIPTATASSLPTFKPLLRLCDPLPQRSHDVQEYASPTAPRPTVGGTVIPGTYRLYELRAYKGAPSAPRSTDEETAHLASGPTATSRFGRVTLYVTKDTLRFNEARSESGPLPAADRTRGFTYHASDSRLVLTPQCPSQGPELSMPFTANGDWLTLAVDATHAEVYTRAY